MSAIQNRYDFVYLFDVTDGNPNGDPDAGNQPRIDPETGEGLVTDVCIKRKIRNAVQLIAEGRLGYEIYFQTQDAPNHLRILNKQHQRAHDVVTKEAPPPVPIEAGSETKEEPKSGKKGRKSTDRGPDKSADTTSAARKWMCGNFYDIRTFGAVMTTGEKNCGQVRGPVQLTFARSIGPILSLEHAITRKSVTTESDAEEQIKRDGNITGTMGRKMTVPYGLYRAHGFVSANLAADTGFTDDDLAVLWRALVQMFEFDRSATRGQMAARGLYVFKHASKLGCAASHALQARVTARRKDEKLVARSFEDFVIAINKDSLPAGVELLEVDCNQFADQAGFANGNVTS